MSQNSGYECAKTVHAWYLAIIGRVRHVALGIRSSLHRLSAILLPTCFSIGLSLRASRPTRHPDLGLRVTRQPECPPNFCGFMCRSCKIGIGVGSQNGPTKRGSLQCAMMSSRAYALAVDWFRRTGPLRLRMRKTLMPGKLPRTDLARSRRGEKDSIEARDRRILEFPLR